jgi:hypothetical protein
MEEMDCDNTPWHYFYNEATEAEAATADLIGNNNNNKLTGTRAQMFCKEDTGRYHIRVISRMKNKHKFKFGDQLHSFLAQNMELLGNDVKILRIHTDYHRNGLIFRGSPRHLGKVWHDWVMIDWAGGEILPAQIWCFVDLRNIPNGLYHQPGIYAVIESAEPKDDNEEATWGELFTVYIKETDGLDDDGNLKRKFYLVDVEAFHSPACLIPDLGNEDKAAFLRLLPKSEWSNQFSAWLKTPHTREFT